MFKEWDPLHSVSFSDNLKFDEKGRVIVEVNLNFGNRDMEIFYFPNLIKEVIGGVDLRFARVKHLDSLEKIGGRLDIFNNAITRSFKMLKKVGGNLNLSYSESAVVSFDFLEEIDGNLDIRYNFSIKTIEDFLMVFPKLKKIGEDNFHRSIFVDQDYQRKLAVEFKKIRDEGKLQFDGLVSVVVA